MEVARSAKIKIIGFSKPLTVETHKVFPIVEGIFGPLRVPLPRTPKILDVVYEQWRTTTKFKSFDKNGHPTKDHTLSKRICRSVWPDAPLQDAGPFLGG